ncbi:ovomucoid-like [Phacochoerus africanus]|uniref:ovomucoid-like n=1 Tax=Phacochoerus africanus TaxID=41426 RepID=UPI001FD8F9D1|nr:ovomucoid-like [Phacochoerus africanus]
MDLLRMAQTAGRCWPGGASAATAEGSQSVKEPQSLEGTDIFGNTVYKISCSHYQKKSIQRKHICSIRVSPLCASNNVTYSNSCVYCFANIALQLTLRVKHTGKCHRA